MKKILLCILIIIGLVSCEEKTIYYEGKTFSNYDMYVNYSINKLNKPIVYMNVVKYKVDTDTLYDVMIKDASGKIECYNRNSLFAELVGSNYHVGDTIK